MSDIARYKSVKFWINTFIPRDILGITKICSSYNSGKTMIKVPSLRSKKSKCFLTDNRNFDGSIYAPSRIHSEVEISLTDSTPSVISQKHRCDILYQINCETGNTEKILTLDPTNSRFYDLNLRDGKIQITTTGKSLNPLAEISSSYIYHNGKFGIDLNSKKVSFEGFIRDFPAYESYYSFNGSLNGNELFRIFPPARNSVDQFNINSATPSRIINEYKTFS